MRKNNFSNNLTLIVLCIVLPILFISCGTSVQQVKSTPDLQLRKYNNIIAYLVNTSRSISASTASLGNINSEQLSSGAAQGERALESLQFELMSIGFNFVQDESQADATVEFTIGNIRYDPVAGWIADQALVKFKDARTGKILAFFRANTQFVTPTVNNIVSNLGDAIKDSY